MKKMTFKEFVNNEKNAIKLEIIDIVPNSGFSNAYMKYSDYLTEELDNKIDYLTYIQESVDDTLNYTDYVASKFSFDSLDNITYVDYLYDNIQYNSRKKIYDKRKKTIKKLLGE